MLPRALGALRPVTRAQRPAGKQGFTCPERSRRVPCRSAVGCLQRHGTSPCPTQTTRGFTEIFSKSVMRKTGEEFAVASSSPLPINLLPGSGDESPDWERRRRFLNNKSLPLFPLLIYASGMGRLSRIAQSERLFFVTTNLRRSLRHFNPAERTLICEVFHATHRRRGFRLAGFVAMPNLINLLVLPTPQDTLSRIVQEIKSVTSRKINARRRKRGSLWQKAFFDHYMRTPDEFLETLEYIHQNPVHKGLATTATDWTWSSARAYATEHSIIPVDFLDLPAETEKRSR